MSKVTPPADLGKLKDIESLVRYIAPLLQELVKTINGKIEFDTNMKTQLVDVSFVTANADTEIDHGLAKTDVSYIVVSKSATCDVYDGAVAASESRLFLKSTAIADVKLLLF